MEQRVSRIEEKLDTLTNNHLHHLSLDNHQLKSDVTWIKKIGGYYIVTSIGLISTILIKLFFG